MGAFTVVGVSVLAYLTFLSFSPRTNCPVGDFGFFSCDEVIYSRYVCFYGVSVALLRFVWFTIALVLIILARQDKRFTRIVAASSLVGAAGVAAFVYTEVFLLRSICPLCTIAHFFGLAILFLSIVDLRARHESHR